MRRIAHPIESLRKRYFRLFGGVRVARRLGARWLLDPGEAGDLRYLAGRRHDVEQRCFLANQIRDRGATRFFDIGANRGLYAVLFGLDLDLPDGIDAFEPVEVTFLKLQVNVWLNGLQGRVRAHRLALSDRSGEVTMTRGRNFLATSHVGTPPTGEEARAERVGAARLDDLVDLSGQRLAIKIDVEGHELSTLAGMAGTLARNACILQIEIARRPVAEVDAVLAPAGYRPIHRIAKDHYYANAAEPPAATPATEPTAQATSTA
ncbi:MAG: FkbM family methyltransferase [Pseudomonadota bacterium]